LDADLYMDKQIWIEHYPHKLLQDWMRFEWEYRWLFFICHVSSVIANIITESSVIMWWNLGPDFCIIVCPNFRQIIICSSLQPPRGAAEGIMAVNLHLHCD
jgi:hypothetical protein